MNFVCPICGFDDLFESPYDENGLGSYEICPCCGFQFGNDDYPDKEKQIHQWRATWISNGHKWFSDSRQPPKNWDWKNQLKNIKY